MEEKYRIYLGDALQIGKRFKAGKIYFDAIITDPPYNISKDNNFSTLKKPRKGIDFGEWDKTFNVCGWINNYVELLKPNGCIIIFCSYLYISFLIEELKKYNIDVKDILIWKKSNPMPRNINRRYVQDMEFAIWGVKKNAKWTFNKPDDVSYLRSTFEAPVVSGAEKTSHPTQKSLKIMEEIIKIHTNENDLILDPFMGSGTTGVACLLNQRKFVGIEMDSNYFEIANNRLRKTYNEMQKRSLNKYVDK